MPILVSLVCHSLRLFDLIVANSDNVFPKQDNRYPEEYFFAEDSSEE